MATAKALSMPEILSLIFTWINCDDNYHTDSPKSYTPESTLLRCATVNKRWSHQAIRQLWTSPTTPLPALFTTIPRRCRRRRQFYANLIQTASLHTVPDHEARETDAILSKLKFPKLRHLHLYNPGYDDLHIPVLRCSLTHLRIDPRCGCLDDDEPICDYITFHEQVERMFGQVVALFPDVAYVSVLDDDRMCDGALNELREGLPALKGFEYPRVIDMDKCHH